MNKQHLEVPRDSLGTFSGGNSVCDKFRNLLITYSIKSDHF